MISSGAYNYINVLEKTADASWLRHSVISNNIANADTPTYKRKDVNFQSYLEEQLSGLYLACLKCALFGGKCQCQRQRKG